MLIESQCKTAQFADKSYKLFDSQGLYLQINRSSKIWLFKYMLCGKESTVTIGNYPAISLQQARKQRDDLKQKVREGVSPAKERAAKRLELKLALSNDFESVSKEWLDVKEKSYSPGHLKRIKERLANDIWPTIGSMPISEITPQICLATVRHIEKRGAIDSAHRTVNLLKMIFDYGIITGRIIHNPSAGLRVALSKPEKSNFTAITDPKQLGELLRLMDDNFNSRIKKVKGLLGRYALQVMPYLFIRTNELCSLRWDNVDFEAAEIRYYVTKTKQQHIVPLSRQAMELLSDLHKYTWHCTYIFSFDGDKPLDPCALSMLMKRLTNGAHTIHGWRATARTILDEKLGYQPWIIEHQLAHAVKDSNGRSYNRTTHLPERKEMMQKWADYLDNLKLYEQPIFNN